MYEPKDAVRDALGAQVKGSTSGSWLTADPRPNLGMVSDVIALGQDDPVAFYDFLLDLAERAGKDARQESHWFASGVLHGVETLATRTDSHAMHVYADSLRNQLYPKDES